MIDWWGPIFIEYYAGTEGNGVTIANTRGVARPSRHGRPLARRPDPHRRRGREGNAARGKSARCIFPAARSSPITRIRPRPQGAYNAKGWSSLGDVGYLDADGYLYLTDRRAYMIISGGVNVYPQEAENVLVNHPAVADVAVFGVPNEEMGEEVKAVVQAAPGHTPGPRRWRTN